MEQAGLYQEIIILLKAGGFVMPPLIIVTAILWYALGKRMVSLFRGSPKNLQALIKDNEHHEGVITNAIKRIRSIIHLNESVIEEYILLEKNKLKHLSTIVSTIVGVAPLLGLLGTVSGMIETFDTLANMKVNSSSSGISGGISEALVSTQMGLIVALPGLIVGKLLDRKESNLKNELDQLKEMAINRKDLFYEV